ncbi:MAG: ATP synthase F1 subunit delta [Chitinophagaceae bacterium]|nr:ATP synthase F1 subunit delta [Oligoflexus sp.]
MSSEKIASRYASALMELTKGDAAVQAKIDSQLTSILDLFADKEIKKVIASPIVNTELMSAVFKNVADQIGAPEILKQFFRVLVDARRTAIIPEIKQAFHKQFLESQGQVEATAITAVQLDAGELDQIKAKLEGMLNKKVLLTTQIDKSILGGFVIKIDNNLIDMSLRTKLDNMTKFAVS